MNAEIFECFPKTTHSLKSQPGADNLWHLIVMWQAKMFPQTVCPFPPLVNAPSNREWKIAREKGHQNFIALLGTSFGQTDLHLMVLMSTDFV
jgi:hypothetical protein